MNCISRLLIIFYISCPAYCLFLSFILVTGTTSFKDAAQRVLARRRRPSNSKAGKKYFFAGVGGGAICWVLYV